MNNESSEDQINVEEDKINKEEAKDDNLNSENNTEDEELIEQAPNLEENKEDEPNLEESKEVMNSLLSAKANGEDYVKDTGQISTIYLDNLSGTIDVKSKANININVVTKTLDGISVVGAKKVWVAFTIELDKYSQEGGEWKFSTGSYSWLYDMETGSKEVSPRLVNDVWVLEGRALIQDNGAIVVPGNINIKFDIENMGGVKGETANIKATAWLYSNDIQQKIVGTGEVPLNSTPSFDIRLINSYKKNQVVSGYYNGTTNHFSIFRPDNMDGYKFGRVYMEGASVMKDGKGNEGFNHTLPISYDINYKVTKVVDGMVVEDTDLDYAPVILAAKQNLNTVTVSQLGGSSVNDMTFNNLLNLSLNNSVYGQGNYTFARISSGLKVSLLLDKKDVSISRIPGHVAYIFVPLDKNDTADVERKLVVEYSNFSATSITGQSINDSNLNNNVNEYSVPETNLDEKGDGGTPEFTRTTSVPKSVMSYMETGKVQSILKIGDEKRLLDYNINSLNILTKFENGFEINNAYTNILKGQYTGTVTILYAVKEDGSNWSDEYEMNHTQDHELRYYDTLDQAKQKGAVVGVLSELRGGVWFSIGTANVPFSPLIMDIKTNGKSGQSYAVVQDIKIWRGSKKITNENSYKNSNGRKIEKFLVDYSDILVPYDNPKNTSGVYLKDIWNDVTGVPEQKELSTWGDTFFIVGQKVVRDKNTTAILNGSAIRDTYDNVANNSTYSVSDGERVADRVYGFNVENPGSDKIRIKLDLSKKFSNGSGNIVQVGKVYLSTDDNPVAYIANTNPAKGGMFIGGIEIDPNDFTVPGEGSYQVYFSCSIGTPNNIFTDIDSGEYQNVVEMTLYPESKKYAILHDVRHVYYTTITKVDINGLNKKTISAGAIDEVGYEISIASGSKEMKNIFVLDVLPFNGDGRGTIFHGSYSIKDNRIPLEIQSASGTTNSRITLFYTSDEGIRTAGPNGSYGNVSLFDGWSISSLGESFEAGNSNWYKAIENSDGSWSIPNNEVPTAILSCGSLNEKESASFVISLALKGQKLGDVYTNAASGHVEGWVEPQDTAKTPSRVSTRTISGIAWVDENADKLYTDSIDKKLEGIAVHLFRNDGTEITTDAEGVLYDIYTGANGDYYFEKVPYYVGGYYVKFESQLLKQDYQPIDQYAAGGQNAMTHKDDNDTIADLESSIIIALNSDVFLMKSDVDLVNESIAEQIYSVDAGVKKSAIIFDFDVLETLITVPKDTTLEDIKDLIGATASVVADGVETDLTDTIDLSELDGFNTSIYGNTITFNVKVKNPITGIIETISVTVKIEEAPVIPPTPTPTPNPTPQPTPNPTPNPTPTPQPIPTPTPIKPAPTPTVKPDDEKEKVVVVVKDIPLSKTENGITDDLIKECITITNETDKNIKYEIV